MPTPSERRGQGRPWRINGCNWSGKLVVHWRQRHSTARNHNNTCHPCHRANPQQTDNNRRFPSAAAVVGYSETPGIRRTCDRPSKNSLVDNRFVHSTFRPERSKHCHNPAQPDNIRHVCSPAYPAPCRSHRGRSNLPPDHSEVLEDRKL